MHLSNLAYIPQACMYMPTQPPGLSHPVTLVESGLSWIAFPCSTLPSWPVATWPRRGLNDRNPSASPGIDRPLWITAPLHPIFAGLPASWTYKVWPSDSSCLVIQLLSPFSVVRTFICLRTLLRSSSPGGRGFPGGGKARQPQKGTPAPEP